MIVRSLALFALALLSACQSWDPSRATRDAQRDIADHKIRFAFVGGRASYPPGVPDDPWKTVLRYPILEVGEQGCEQDSRWPIREEYARRYNTVMWKYVSSLRR